MPPREPGYYPTVIGNRTETVIGNLADAARAILIGGNEQQPILQGSGTPENNINAPVGAWFMRTTPSDPPLRAFSSSASSGSSR